MNTIKKICLLILCYQVSACHWLSAARIITQQGNIVTAKQCSKLKIGMTKTEAAIALGSSLISPTFNDNRWDYSYTWQKGEGPVVIKRLSLYFNHDRLAAIKTRPFEE